jgi:outer membrane receptor for ferrienterochelin and colicins
MSLHRAGSAFRCSSLILALASASLEAQGGRITGVVVDDHGQPLPRAQILVPLGGLAAEGREDGTFTIRDVPAGTYVVRVYRLGFKPRDYPNITVESGRATSVTIALEPAVVQLGGVVVSASRRLEKITDAPATVTRLQEPEIASTLGNSFLPALKEVNGIEFIRVGITAVALNARGFNLSFNNRMLMMEDGRIATLAESGLPVGNMTTIPKVDLAGVEVLVGPGAALYGPDASNGVLTLQTKDPRQYPGWTIEASGGSRKFRDVQARFARAAGKFGFKVSGEYQAADDWRSSVFYPPVAAGGAPIAENSPNFETDVARASGALAWYAAEGSRLSLTAGMSRLNGIGQTSVGRNQFENYEYRNYQLQYSGSRLFAQVYVTNSLTNGTYALNSYSQNSVRFPALSRDSLKTISAFPADGRLQAAEVQHNFPVGAYWSTGLSALDNTHVIWGVQLRRDRVSTFGRWLSDRLTGEPIVNDQKGGYTQVETPLTSALRFVAAARYDTHERYDAQFSPKAALLFSPATDQTVRVTFNRAFKSPTVLQTDFHYPNFQPFVGVFGNPDGFDVKKADGTIVSTVNPLVPETNTTWELGYKAAIRNVVFVDVAAYRSHYMDFLSPLVPIANPLTATTATTFPTTAYNHRTGAKVTDAAGGPQVALTYFNVGEARIRGLEAGLRYYVADWLTGSANVNFIRVDTIQIKPTDPAEATSFNSASSRMTAGLDLHDAASTRNLGLTVRYVNGYDFRAGVNYGRIPGFATLDASAGYRIAGSGMSLMLQAQNIFACVSGTSTPPASGVSAGAPAVYSARRSCGFGQEHGEMINMPLMGTMLFVGARFDGR